MKRTLRLSVIVVGFALADAAAAADSPDIATAIRSGDPGVAIRYRFEHVDQDGIDEDANASTARLRLNYRTGSWRGFSAYGEFDHVFHVLLRDFNSGAGTSPGRVQYPVVADPSGPDLNQLYLDYAAAGDWKLRAGRQRILLDNQRFVGNVGWRQNEQTYDAFRLDFSNLPQTELSYSYVAWVRRIFGDSTPAGRNKTDHHLLNAKVTLTDEWTLSPYVYYLDYEYPEDATNSTATVGLRVEGRVAAVDGTLTIVGEFATQSDAGNNPVSYDAQYLHFDALWAVNDDLSVGIGIESLGGSSAPGGAFRTPLATLHKFQGWADKFLATPDGGVDDLYASVKYSFGGWNLTGVYHDFSAETGGGDYGSEIDLSAGYRFGKDYGVLIKAALFDGDSPGFTDTTKLWLMLTADW